MVQTVFDWAACPVLESVPGKLGARGHFAHASVVHTGSWNISDMNVNEIAAAFPTVRLEQIVSFLEFLPQGMSPRP